MERWEYCLKHGATGIDMLTRGQVENLLNAAGTDGWELVAVERHEDESLL
jgi:hypothetical protein